MLDNNVIDAIFYLDKNISKSYFDMFSYTVHLDISCEDYIKTLTEFTISRKFERNIAKIIHENYHFLETLTPFGIYIKQLWKYRNIIGINLIKHITSRYGKNKKVTIPLQKFIRNNMEIYNDQSVISLLFDWCDITIVLSYFCEPISTYISKVEYYEIIRPTALKSFYITKLIENVDCKLHHYLQFHNWSDKYVIPNYNDQTNDQIVDIESKIFTSKQLLFDFNIKSLFESYSKSVELMLNKKDINLSNITIASNKANQDYYFPIIFTQSVIHCERVEELLLTFMAICEIALSCPAIPQLSALRHGIPNLYNYDIGARFLSLVFESAKIRPVQSIVDYQRYTNEICNVLKWPSPNLVAQCVVENYRYPENDTISAMFKFFQLNKINGNNIFLDFYGIINYLNSDISLSPYVELKDVVFKNPVINDEVYFTLNYLLDQLIVNILENDNLVLVYPYATNNQLFEFNKKMIYSLMKDLGLVINGIEIVNPNKMR